MPDVVARTKSQIKFMTIFRDCQNQSAPRAISIKPSPHPNEEIERFH